MVMVILKQACWKKSIMQSGITTVHCYMFNYNTTAHRVFLVKIIPHNSKEID